MAPSLPPNVVVPPSTLPAPPIFGPNSYARKRDLEVIDYMADKYGIPRDVLSAEGHERKRSSGRGGKDNLGKEAIEKIAKEIKEAFGSKQ
jgi:hypothetical protein